MVHGGFSVDEEVVVLGVEDGGVEVVAGERDYRFEMVPEAHGDELGAVAVGSVEQDERCRTMKTTRKGPSTLFKALFKAPVWLYRGHLGFLFFGGVIVIVHRGRNSGIRYLTGLELLDRRDGELFVLSLWGAKSDWYRNIEANGVDELWDGTKRTGASFRIVASDEAFGILSNTEKAHERLVRFFWPRMYPGYDFTDESRRTLAGSGVIVAFTAS